MCQDANQILDITGNIISIATPVILLFWFYYSQKQILSKNYFNELDGLYAGFTEHVTAQADTRGLHSGIILNIRETDDKGYFKGEFDFGETKMEIVNGKVISNNLLRSINTFIGKMEFKLYRNISRHPFRPEENRIYKGTLYLVTRLDIIFENYKIEDVVSTEYDIIHYREMQIMKFSLKKTHREGSSPLPPKFTLYKKIGASFEPYNSVTQTVFTTYPPSSV